MKKTLLAVLLGVAVGFVAPTLAARTAGTYNLPNTPTVKNPVTAGQVITKEWANGTLQDIGSALTDSLDRTSGGAGDMARALRGINGDLGGTFGPTFSFTNSTNTGIYLPSVGVLGLAAGGGQAMTCASTGCTVPSGKTFTATGAVTLDNATTTFSNAGAQTITKTTGGLTISAAAGSFDLLSSGTTTIGTAALRFQVDSTSAGLSPAAKITGVLTPTTASDAANKSYVDGTAGTDLTPTLTWTTLTVGGAGCAAGAVVPAYTKYRAVVYLRGSVVAGATSPSGCTLTALAANYRPGANRVFLTTWRATGGGTSEVGTTSITAAGGVFSFSALTNGTVQLDGISFPAEQ